MQYDLFSWRRRRYWLMILVTLYTLLSASIIYQTHLRNIRLILALGLLIFLSVKFGRALLKVALLAMPFLLSYGLFRYVGTYSYLRDLICLAASGLASLTLVSRLEKAGLFTRERRSEVLPRARRRFVSRYCHLIASASGTKLLSFVIAFALIGWSLLSAGDWLFNSTRRTHKSGVVRVRHEEPRWRNVRVGVALSGGGYRAALMHAGVLNALDEMGVRVKAVSSVSGGSIIGSFYSVGGPPEEFLGAVVEGRFNLKRELFDLQNLVPILQTWKMPGLNAGVLPQEGNGRSGLQARLVDRVLLGGARFRDADQEENPALMLCTTDLTSGSMMGVTSDWTIRRNIQPAVKRTKAVNQFTYPSHASANSIDFAARDEPISTFVAASGAFPAAFSSVRYRYKFQAADGQEDENELMLADGGINDNLGLELMRGANYLAKNPDRYRATLGDAGAGVNLGRWDLDVMLVSDGGAFFSIQNKPDSVLSEIARALDVMYANGGQQTPVEAWDRPTILFSPGSLAVLPTEETFNLKDENMTAAFAFSCLDCDMHPYLRFKKPNFRQLAADAGSLSLVARSMPPVLTEEAKKLAEAVSARNAAPSSPSSISGPSPDGSGIVRCEQEQTDPERRLYCMIARDMWDCVVAFANTSTLDDQMDEVTARRIYRLGQYLALINKPAISYYLDAFTESAALRAEAEGLEKEAKQILQPGSTEVAALKYEINQMQKKNNGHIDELLMAYVRGTYPEESRKADQLFIRARELRERSRLLEAEVKW